jgi:DNA replication protein DnaC
LGKTHLSIALGRAACAGGYTVLFTTAIGMIQTLSAATAVGAGELQQVMKRYLKPSLLILDEVGYLPIDKLGADLLFQVISQRYERGSIVLTNRPFKKWAQIFNNDSTLTSALLDRLLHHAEVIVIEGTSFRGKGLVETDPAA